MISTFKNPYTKERFTDWAAFRETGADIADLAENKVFASGLTKEEFDALELSWKDFLFQLDYELPADKRKEILLDTLRKNYAWESEKLNKLQTSYDESHEKREAYDIRKRIAEQSEILKELHK